MQLSLADVKYQLILKLQVGTALLSCCCVLSAALQDSDSGEDCGGVPAAAAACDSRKRVRVRDEAADADVKAAHAGRRRLGAQPRLASDCDCDVVILDA
jgi:hypothetical protein